MFMRSETIPAILLSIIQSVFPLINKLHIVNLCNQKVISVSQIYQLQGTENV